MSWFVIDVESDGPHPPDFSMVCFGVVKVDENLDTTFYGQTKPISFLWLPDALKISGFSREEHKNFPDPEETMVNFGNWLLENSKGRPVMLSNNIAYDWQWINYYMHKYFGYNPLGYSGRRIGDMYCGMVKDSFASWKHLRKEKFSINDKTYCGYDHNHDPLQDALGNAHVLLYMKEKLGLKIPTK